MLFTTGPALDRWPNPLPSWVPLWNEASSIDFHLGPSNFPFLQHASPSFNNGIRSVIIEGFRFDSVRTVSQGDLVDLDCLAHFWAESVQPLASPHHDLLFCEALMNKEVKLYTGNTRQRAAFTSYRAAHYVLTHFDPIRTAEAAVTLTPAESMLKSICLSIEICSRDESETDTIKDSHPDYERFWRGRRLFATSDRYVGLGPEAMREGDIITFLAMNKAPSILRPQDDFYQYIGTANIPGVLNGGVEDQITDANIEVFEIR